MRRLIALALLPTTACSSPTEPVAPRTCILADTIDFVFEGHPYRLIITGHSRDCS